MRSKIQKETLHVSGEISFALSGKLGLSMLGGQLSYRIVMVISQWDREHSMKVPSVVQKTLEFLKVLSVTLAPECGSIRSQCYHGPLILTQLGNWHQ